MRRGYQWKSVVERVRSGRACSAVEQFQARTDWRGKAFCGRIRRDVAVVAKSVWRSPHEHSVSSFRTQERGGYEWHTGRAREAAQRGANGAPSPLAQRTQQKHRVFLRQKIEEYGSEEMLGKLLHDVEHEIHQ